MIKIGIAIDPWKLKIFKKVFDEAGYTYDVKEGASMTVLRVDIEAEDTSKLQPIVAKANNIAKNSKKH